MLLEFGPKYPFTFGVGVATIKTGVADALVQKAIEKREELDYKRLALFTVFGFAYLGVFQYLLCEWYILCIYASVRLCVRVVPTPTYVRIFRRQRLLVSVQEHGKVCGYAISRKDQEQSRTHRPWEADCS